MIRIKMKLFFRLSYALKLFCFLFSWVVNWFAYSNLNEKRIILCQRVQKAVCNACDDLDSVTWLKISAISALKNIRKNIPQHIHSTHIFSNVRVPFIRFTSLKIL